MLQKINQKKTDGKESELTKKTKIINVALKLMIQ